MARGPSGGEEASDDSGAGAIPGAPRGDDASGRRRAVPVHSLFKRLVLGRPLATQEAVHERLRKLVALPVFSSDAISSTGYGTEVILSVLVPVAGLAALHYLVPISLIVVAMLVILEVSYRQTIFAYPRVGVRTSSAARTWGGSRRCSPGRRCWSTTR